MFNPKEYHRRYRQTKKYKVSQKRYRQSEVGKAHRRNARKRCDKKYTIEHPKQIKATKKINNAIVAGKLPRPDTFQCRYCPAQAQHYHHYKGYEPKHWFVVIPVCINCHRRIHKKSA